MPALKGSVGASACFNRLEGDSLIQTLLAYSRMLLEKFTSFNRLEGDSLIQTRPARRSVLRRGQWFQSP